MPQKSFIFAIWCHSVVHLRRFSTASDWLMLPHAPWEFQWHGVLCYALSQKSKVYKWVNWLSNFIRTHRSGVGGDILKSESLTPTHFNNANASIIASAIQSTRKWKKKCNRKIKEKKVVLSCTYHIQGAGTVVATALKRFPRAWASLAHGLQCVDSAPVSLAGHKTDSLSFTHAAQLVKGHVILRLGNVWLRLKILLHCLTFTCVPAAAWYRPVMVAIKYLCEQWEACNEQHIIICWGKKRAKQCNKTTSEGEDLYQRHAIFI